MYTVKHNRIIDNYIELLKAGLEKAMATFIARALSAKVILDVAVSDTGIHLNIWDNETTSEKAVVFAFKA
ncbi:hypothetical protein PA10_00259 [Pseudomonas phage pPa_SNUABM_DT01]|nr:hypothetical protein PA10_00259 [Pseudomonas phage pPa_SNUABM_DT01]